MTAQLLLLDGPAGPPLRPFITWVGGKYRLLPQLRKLLPADYYRRRHIEPFMGAGTVFLGLRPHRAVLADLNADLVLTFRVVRDQPAALIEALRPLAETHSKEAFYERRAIFNRRERSDVEQAALFVYLMKTGAGAFCRYNRKGEWNNGYRCAGWNGRPERTYRHILRASEALQGVHVRHEPFDAVLRYALPDDFVYFDPPYLPDEYGPGITTYTKHGFSITDQERLRDVFSDLDKRLQGDALEQLLRQGARAVWSMEPAHGRVPEEHTLRSAWLAHGA